MTLHDNVPDMHSSKHVGVEVVPHLPKRVGNVVLKLGPPN